MDLGVEVVDDLDTLFESTDDLLPKARKALGATEYQHMFCAYKHFQGNSRLDDRDEEPYANDNSSWAVVSCANPDYSKENLIASQLTDKKEFKKERRISGTMIAVLHII